MKKMMYSNTITSKKTKNFKKTAKKLLHYIGAYKISIVTAILFAILSTAFMIIGPKLLGNVTTEIYSGIMSKISGTGNGIDFVKIGKIFVFLIAIYLLSFVFSYIQGLIMTNVSMKATYRLREDISNKINRLPLKYFDKTNHGDILSLVINDVDTLTQTLSQSITQIITSITTIIGIAAMMILISPLMTLVAVGMVFASFLVTFIVVKKSQIHFVRQQDFLGKISGYVEEVYKGQNIIKAFNAQNSSFEKFEGYNDNLYNAAWKSQFLSETIMPMINFVSTLGYVAVCVLGGYLAITSGFAVGNIQAFIQYTRQFITPITQISNISNILQQTMAAAERIFKFLDEDEEVSDDKSVVCVKDGKYLNTNTQKVTDIKGSVKFENIKFGYDKNKITIDNVSINVKPGQNIAIVGPTGAGKTTIVKLLMRFYDLINGEIYIDGINIKDMKRNDLRSIFGMVLQDTWLYNSSIKENIRYGNLNATDDAVIKAAKAAQVDHFVQTLPGGYDMIINEEINNISQGQKQLLTIARAILSDPKILILDEATSSVDTRTELMIQKAMNNLMKNKTSFIIAHRLSTIKNADMILVMDNGKIVEQGTHSELLAAKGFYYTMYNSQFAKTA